MIPSPASSDAYNTADARIHFGPLRSPEKKFYPIVAPHSYTPCPSSSPSPTISHSPWKQCQSIHVNVDDESASSEEVADLLHPGTPQDDQYLQDEPPSVLATRIIRAHDNPSPPPEPPTFGFADSDYRRSITPSRSPLPLPEDMTAVDQRRDLISSTLATGSHEFENSLLIFDSPLTPPIISPPSDSPPASSCHTPPLINQPSVDDLLSLSSGPGYHSAYDKPSRSTSPSPSIPGFEQRKEDKPFEDNKSTQPTTSESMSSDIADARQSVGPSAGSPRLQSLHVLLIDDGSTETTREMSTQGRTTDNQSHLSCSNGAEISPESPKENGTIQKDYLIDDDAIKRDATVGPITKRDSKDAPSANRNLFLTSANSLAHLLSSPPKLESGTVLDVTQNNVSGVSAIAEETDSSLPALPPQLPQPPKTPTPGTRMHVTGPIRFSSPVRSREPQSPTKGRLQSAALDDFQRTPARRILIEEAIAQGHASPHKRKNFVGRLPILRIPPTDSPARRVNVDQASPLWQGLSFGSPARGTSPEKQRTAISHPSRVSSSKNKDTYGSQMMKGSSSKSRIAGTSSAPAMSTSLLPFPIVASETVPSSSTLESKSTTGDNADVKTSSPVKSDSPPMLSPAKSSLKQTTSKIPRGIKPYARPVMPADRQGKSTSATVILAKARAPAPTRNGTNYDDALLNSEVTTAIHGKSAPTSTLKRKRGVEKSSTLTKPRPVVLLRQVPRIAPPASDVADVNHARPGVVRSTTVKESVQTIRRVPEVQGVQAIQDSDSDASETPNIEVNDDKTTPKLQVIRDKLRSPSPLGLPEQSIPLDTGQFARRRTTRIRKTVNPIVVADVFADATPPQPRRRANKTQSSGDGVFSGMSAVALKALTSSNTIRNQKYLAAKLETEVVRKPGARPESPAVKIKPTLQRQRDAKGKERKERADRRARQSDGRIGEGKGDSDRQSDVGDSSAADLDSDWDEQSSSPVRKRHKRAPGDEEDYETPLRTSVGEDDEDEVTAEKRRVKWDRGLFTTIYLDEVTVGPRRPPKENIASKGCLAATAKVCFIQKSHL
ncbi:hypothetical protein L208DRAFT_259678 [Tricholoma matsutake]|nr:hypothetical protein L208DRAFT_259678 [Tricholoma matsutake 945]